jgi:hypothetical protein
VTSRPQLEPNDAGNLDRTRSVAGLATRAPLKSVRLAMALNTMLLWVPARAGSAEGVRVVVFVLLGLPAAQGAAYSLARRARELAWILPGAFYLLSSPLRGRSARGAEVPALAAGELP